MSEDKTSMYHNLLARIQFLIFPLNLTKKEKAVLQAISEELDRIKKEIKGNG